MKLKNMVLALTSLALVNALLAGTAGATTGKPSNDDVAAAVPIENTDFTEQRDLSGATLERKEALPSCGALKGSVWYRFVAPEDKVYQAWFQASFDAGIAAYRASDSGLKEVSCSAFGSLGGVALDAQAGDEFYIQLGNTRQRQGIVEVGVALARWQEETLYEKTYTRDVKEQRINLLTVRGAPNPLDPWLYDVEIGISRQVPTKESILTFGLVHERIDLELVRIPASTTTLAVRIVARYDTAQRKCAVDDATEIECAAYIPVRDPGTFASHDGMGSHLAIEVAAMHNGNVLVEETFLIPFAGQAGGSLSVPRLL